MNCGVDTRGCATGRRLADRVGSMARTRICRACGVDTCRCVPFREPHYGLMVVACGRCGHVSPTRKEHGTAAWWRRFSHLRKAIQALVLQLTALGLAVLSLAFFGAGLELSLRSNGISIWRVLNGQVAWGRAIGKLYEWHRTGDSLFAFVAAGMWAAAGAWIGSSLRHAGAVRSCAAIVFMGLAIASLGVVLKDPDQSATRVEIGVNRAALIVAGAFIMVLATPLGHVVRSARQELKRLSMARRLRGLRRWRRR